MQASKTSWSGGGSGLIGLMMIAGSSATAQDMANKTNRMCMEARGYTAQASLKGEQAARARTIDFCVSQLKSSGQALGGKTFFPPSTAATPAMLSDNSKVTPEQKTAILAWGNARQKCFDRESQELGTVNYPQQLEGISKAVSISTNINLVRLYRGEVTWGDFNRVRNEYNVEYLRGLSDASMLIAQATPEAVQRANQIVLDQQQVSAERLLAVMAPQSSQVGCTNHQLGDITFTNCN